jgi:demethylmenaquinone methyltransferase/2-methoxy-6-polyprenyl-1,4-benzoquinol methylase
MNVPPITQREQIRESAFNRVWAEQLNDAFINIAPYYDLGNQVASLGCWNWFLHCFMSMIELQPEQRVLDVCAGTNAIGIALLKREPTLEVNAIDRSTAMQEVGRQRAEKLGFTINSTIADVHSLPFPDNHFDVVTLQFASRHLRIAHMFGEINRVLKPGGCFYHCDMLRPSNPFIERIYYLYLHFCLRGTGMLLRSSSAALNLIKYFVDALELFYSTKELTQLLKEQGYNDIKEKSIFLGMLGCHRAVKPLA